MASDLAEYLTRILNGTIVHEDDRQLPEPAEGEDPAEAFGRMLVNHLGWPQAEATDNFESGGRAELAHPAYDASQGIGAPQSRREAAALFGEESLARFDLSETIYRKLGPHGMIPNPPETWDANGAHIDPMGAAPVMYLR